MALTVYIWLASGLYSFGHTSLKLGDGTYISTWPGRDNTLKMVKSDSGNTKKLCLDENVKSLEEDLKFTGRNFDRSYTLQELDEGAILEWWTHFHKRWDLIWQNCCRTIIQGLRAGGSDQLLPWPTKTKYWLKVFWTPDDVEAYCLALLIGEFGRRISWTKWCLVSFIIFVLWILNRRRYKVGVFLTFIVIVMRDLV